MSMMVSREKTLTLAVRHACCFAGRSTVPCHATLHRSPTVAIGGGFTVLAPCPGTISYPYKGNPTIPGWVPVIIPLIMLIATVAVGELVYSRYQHHNLTDCLATMLHFILDGVQVKGL